MTCENGGNVVQFEAYGCRDEMSMLISNMIIDESRLAGGWDRQGHSRAKKHDEPVRRQKTSRKGYLAFGLHDPKFPPNGDVGVRPGTVVALDALPVERLEHLTID